MLWPFSNSCLTSFSDLIKQEKLSSERAKPEMCRFAAELQRTAWFKTHHGKRGGKSSGGKAGSFSQSHWQSYENKPEWGRSSLDSHCVGALLVLPLGCFFWCLLLLMQAIWVRSSSARMPGIFYLCSGSNTAHCLEIPLAWQEAFPWHLNLYVGTIHCSYSSPLLLLSTLEANTQAILFVQNQPGNSPTFSSFSEYTVVARYYLCIVSLKPSKPKLWFSC